MKWFRNLSFRNKLIVTNLLIVTAVVACITLMMNSTASRQAMDSNRETLDLLTEQALINFSSQAEGMGKNIYTLYSSTNTAEQMNLMRNMDRGEIGYLLARREMTQAAARMITGSAPYDHASVLLMNGDIVTGNPLDPEATKEAEAILSQPEYAGNAYGKCLWTRTAQGDLWCVRDVYCQSPFRRVGKTAVRVRQEKLAGLGDSSRGKYPCTLLFYDAGGQWLMSAGNELPEEGAPAAAALLDAPADTWQLGRSRYAVSVQTLGAWRAIGLLPMDTAAGVQRSITQSSLLAALLGILIGLVIAAAVSHQLSGQIRRLVQSMDRVAAGDLDVEIPVESADEIGELSRNFNHMTRETRELLARVVQEEASKQQAEYQNLEYRYRFLQWQINPHFIYNALEAVNGLAKLDGSPQVSGIIVQLSAYFRANAQAMSKRFVTVRQEFNSVAQYVEIYRQIYGGRLTVEFGIASGAEEALVPTMLLQPIMENALIHGKKRRGDSIIRAEAEAADGILSICIQDNGPGMTEEEIARMLNGEREAGQSGRVSLGVRNVRERMRLLYGEEATLEVVSRPGEGTRVTLRLPCRYTEKDEDAG